MFSRINEHVIFIEMKTLIKEAGIYLLFALKKSSIILRGTTDANEDT